MLIRADKVAWILLASTWWAKKEYKIRDDLFGEYTEMAVNLINEKARDKIIFRKGEITKYKIRKI